MAMKMKKVIITCTVTDGVHTPTLSDALPLAPDEIARQSIDAVINITTGGGLGMTVEERLAAPLRVEPAKPSP